MGTVTQSRSRPAIDKPTTYKLGSSPATTLYFPTAQRVQTTTSWRTGGGRDLYDGDVDTPSTEAGLFNYLVDEAASRDESPSRPYDNGHAFSTTNTYVDNVPWMDVRGKDFLNQPTSFSGPVVPVPIANYFGLFPSIPSSALPVSAKMGAIAIKQTAPTNPASSFGQGLGETGLDGLPGIPGEELRKKIDFFRSLGKEYLNVQFGWVPFVNDLRSAATAILDRHSILQQYQRDSGKPVRRAFHFKPTIDTTISDPIQLTLSSPLFGSTWDGTDGRSLVNTTGATYQLMITWETNVYFKGSFMYYLPEGNSFLDKMNRNASLAGHLLGTTLTPELLYQLTPWTWLVDWFTHLGRYVSSFSRFATDGLVLQYGYLMAKQTVTYRHIARNWRPGLGSSYGAPRTDELVTRAVRKERFRSTPYGFGLDTSTFTDFQWSILGALGLTKAPKTLRIP